MKILSGRSYNTDWIFLQGDCGICVEFVDSSLEGLKFNFSFIDLRIYWCRQYFTVNLSGNLERKKINLRAHKICVGNINRETGLEKIITRHIQFRNTMHVLTPYDLPPLFQGQVKFTTIYQSGLQSIQSIKSLYNEFRKVLYCH